MSQVYAAQPMGPWTRWTASAYGVEHHPGAAKHTGPLAHRPGEACLIAGEVEGLAAFLVDLSFSFIEDLYHVRPLLQGRSYSYKSYKSSTTYKTVLNAFRFST